MWRISKRINSKLKRKLNFTPRRNSAAVIRWFQSIEMKESCTFTSFDIVVFYLSISEDLFQRAIPVAKDDNEVSNEEVGIREDLGLDTVIICL